ncbi:MAG: hypothetical protein KDC92_14450, partial [Bacteroidetes bacterium]|nr:hypothetical protein [Bacteroidota bacterium]
FDNGYSFLVNTTLYQSKYKASDGVVRNTNFNGNYLANMLATKEFDVTSNARFGAGINFTYGGGRRYGEFDEAESEAQKEVVWQNDGYNQNQYPDYFRIDIRLNYVVNRNKTTHEIAFDLINVLNTPNVLEYVWAPGVNANSNFDLRKQAGFLPFFYYKFDF